MALGELYLGLNAGSLELLTPFSREFAIKNIILSRDGRTTSGRLVRDIIAKKKEFTLSYELIDGDELQTIIDQFEQDDELLFRVYTGASTYDDYAVLMEPVNYDRVLMFDNGLWGNVEIELKEV